MARAGFHNRYLVYNKTVIFSMLNDLKSVVVTIIRNKFKQRIHIYNMFSIFQSQTPPATLCSKYISDI